MLIDYSERHFRVLGPVEVTTMRGAIRFARRQHIDLLALFLLNHGWPVTVERIVSAMWGIDPPDTAERQAQNMVSALRSSFAATGQDLVTLTRRPAGYALSINSGRLDLHDFESLIVQAKSSSDQDRRCDLLRRALGLWHGPNALAGVRACYAENCRRRLEDERISAMQALFDAELARDNHHGIVAELREAVMAHPGNEHLVAQLMLALYRGGRATDALETYRMARHNLVHDFGLEPMPSLQRLERLILTGAPASMVTA